MAAKKIQYSVSMRPNPQHEDDPQKAYASIQLTGKYTLDDLAEHMNEHYGTYSKGTFKGIIEDMAVCIRELLLQGYSVQLDNLIPLPPRLRCKGAVSRDEFTTANILAMPVGIRAGRYIKGLRDVAEFEETTTRAIQRATLKAAKAGQTTADWTPAPEDAEGGEGNDEP